MDVTPLYIPDVARRLGVSTPTVHRWIRGGGIPTARDIRGRQYIDASTFTRLVERLRAMGRTVPAGLEAQS